MRILVVDDDHLARLVLHDELTDAGHEVLQAQDGEQALKILEQQEIQLVVTDWLMPRLDGVGLIRKIRAANLPYYTYMILLTGQNQPAEIVAGLNAGADDYLVKNSDLRELLARVATGERILALENRLRQNTQRLELAAMHDSLTGLRNRQAITIYADREFTRARRESRPLSLILLRLETPPDGSDPAAEDKAIRTLGSTIDSTLRPYDRAGRWSATEFLIVLTDTTRVQALIVAERLLSRASSTLRALPNGEDITLSAGVAEAIDGTPLQLRSLIWQADQALRRASAQGTNQVSAYTSTLYRIRQPALHSRRAAEVG